MHLFSHIELNSEKEEKTLLTLILDNYTSFDTCIEHGLPWFDFIFIEHLLTSTKSNMVMMGIVAFEGCYKFLDNTFHTLKELLSSDNVKDTVTNMNAKVKKIYDELVEKVSKEEDDSEEEANK